MRINVYGEEITSRFEVVEKTADTGTAFVGLRVYLKSPPELHSTAEDDDTSAVTFWFDSRDALNAFISEMARLVFTRTGKVEVLDDV